MMLEKSLCPILTVLLCSGLANVRGDVELPANFEDKVTEYINAGLACHNIPGLSISVVKDGVTVLSR